MRFSQLVLSLPLLICATQLAGSFTAAHAASMSAGEATALLAKSQTLDVKCGILTADRSQSLKDMVARAEISLAEKSGVAVTRKTIASGRSAGKAAACDDTARKLVNDVLAAAEVAVSAPVAEAPAVEADEPQPLSNGPAAAKAKPENNALAAVSPEPEIVPKKQAVLAKPPKAASKAKVAKTTKPAKPAKGLGNYATVAEKYYVALRCGNMSSSSINRLYKNVLSNHQQALAANRPADVRAMLRTAEARAGSKSCS